MSVTFTSSMVGASADYMKYKSGDIRKTDRYKDSTLLDFSLVPGPGFVKLTKGAHIKVNSAKYPNWFTGFITNEPQLEYLGAKGGEPIWGFKYQAASEDYVLNLKPLGDIPPFMNQSKGTILKYLINKLYPGYFNVTNVQDGSIVAQYAVEPDKRFRDVVQDFCESDSFAFWVTDKNVYYVPQDDAALPVIELDKDSPNFTPSVLSVSPSSTPILNDVTVVGSLEPRTYMHEYFVGTGYDAQFPLVSDVFGADTTVLIQDSFSSTPNSSLWDVYDQPSDYIQTANGVLQVLGGAGNGSYNVRVESINPLPLDGRMRLTHGEWDFLSSSANGTSGNVGIIGGLWANSPTLGSLVYGLEIRKVGSNLTIRPNVGGSSDNTQVFQIDTTKRYVLRTLVEFNRTHRLVNEYSYIDATGARNSVSSSSGSDSAIWDTVLTEVDPATGAITRQYVFRTTSSLSSSTLFARYVPFASDNLHATVASVSVSVPVNATLEVKDKVLFNNLSFDQWVDDLSPTGWENPVNAVKDAGYANTGSALKLEMATGTAGSVEQPANELLVVNKLYTVSCRLRRGVSATTGTVKLRVVGTGVTDTGLQVAVSSLDDADYTTHSATLMTAKTSIPSDLKFVVEVVGLDAGSAVWVDDIIVASDWEQKLIGPNEIDAMDGLAPIATIVSQNTGSETKSSFFGGNQYNPGQSVLTFFKDSLTRTSNIPPEFQLVRLSYRDAGPAVGRVVASSSVTSEATKWGDDGVRAITRNDLSPRPRTSLECELAAKALVSENSFTHYEGSYQLWSVFTTSEPRAGGVLLFKNIPDINGGADQAEEINEVVTVLQSPRKEYFEHQITFGKPDRIRRLLAKFESPKGAFLRVPGESSIRSVTTAQVGVNHPPDVVKPILVSWDDNSIYMDSGQDRTATYFEVRYTDEGWGQGDAKNLITRTTSRTFSVPRTLRGRVFFIREVNSDGSSSRYSSCVHIAFPVTVAEASTDTETIIAVEDVVPIGSDAFEISKSWYTDSNGNSQVQVDITYDPPAVIGDFVGVNVFVEAPDASGITVDAGKHWYNGDPLGTGSDRYGTVQLRFTPPAEEEEWRFYLCSYTENTVKKLVLDGLIGETPNMPLTIEPAAGGGGVVLPDNVIPIAGQPFLASVGVVNDSNGIKHISSGISYNPPDPIGNFNGVEVWVNVPDGSIDFIYAGSFDYMGDPDATDHLRYGYCNFLLPPPKLTENWRYYVVSRSATAFRELVPQGEPGASPNRLLSVSPVPPLLTPPPNVSSVSVTDQFNRKGQPNTGEIFTSLRATIAYPTTVSQPTIASLGITGLNILISLDGGTSWEEVGNFAPTTTVDFWWPVPASTVSNAQLRVATFGPSGWNGPAAGTTTTSSNFTITGIQALTGGIITDALVSAISYSQQADGTWTWGFTVSWTNPSAAAQPNFFATAAEVKKVYKVGGGDAPDYEGVWRQFCDIAGYGVSASYTVANNWTIPDPQFEYRIRLLTVDSLQNKVLQSTAFGGLTTATLTPTEPSGPSGTEFTPNVTGQTATVIYGNSEDGSQTYQFAVSCTPPTSASFGGCAVFARSTSAGNPISVVANLPKGQTSARSLPAPVPLSETFDLYFVAYDTNGRANSLVLASTPKATVTVSRSVGSSGAEHAANVTNFVAYNPTTGTGTVGVRYGYGEDGGQRYSFYGTATAPNDPKFAGATVYCAVRGAVTTNGTGVMNRSSGPFFANHMVGKRINVSGFNHTITAVNSPTQIVVTPGWSAGNPGPWGYTFLDDAWIVGDMSVGIMQFQTDFWPVNHDSEDFRIWAVSYDYAGRQNTIVNGVTQFVDLTVTRQTGTTGQEYASLVTGASLDVGQPQYITTEVGETVWIASGIFTEPNDPRYGGVKVVRKNGVDPNKSIEVADIPRGTGKFRTDFQPLIGANTTLGFLSYDTSGRVNTYQNGTTPEINLTLATQGNSLNLAKATPASLSTAAFASGIRPVAILPSAPAAGFSSGDTYPPGSYYYNTSNGITYKNESGVWRELVGAGDLQANSVVFGKVAAGAIGTYQLAATEILVGSPSGGGGATRFRVNDNAFPTPNMIAFFGDLSAGTVVNGVTSVSGFKGAYLLNLRVGTNINSPNLYADSSGVTISNVPVTINTGNGLVVNTNSISTYINNQLTGGVSNYAGVVVQANGSPFMTSAVTPGGFYALTGGSSGSQVAGLQASPGGGGSLFLRGMSGSFPSGGFNFAVSSSGTLTTYIYFGSSPIACYNGTFSYTKPGGATGNITIIGGLVFSVS